MSNHQTTEDVHKGAYVSEVDPALDASKRVLPGKLWVDKSSGVPYVVRVRNADNTDWEPIGAAGGISTPSTLVNEALLGSGATATASTNSGSAPNVIDNDAVSFWEPTSGPATSHYLIIDLGAPKAIGFFRLLFGPATGIGPPTAWNIDSSPDGTTWTTRYSGTGGPITEATEITGGPYTFQFWRLIGTDGPTGQWDITAFELFSGEPGGGGTLDHGSLAGLADDDHTQYQLRTERGANDGYASLDSGGKVPAAELPTLDVVPDPVADLAMATHKITGMGDPTSAQDAATKAYVDALVNGLTWKASVRAASTANVTIASGLENGDTLDGVTLATGDRVLLKNQTTASENGIYVVVASGAALRAPDADSAAELLQAAVFVREGTTNADTAWVLTTNGPITLGTTALIFTQFNGGGGSSLTVREIDGTPSMTATVIEVTNGKLTDQGGGVARLDLSGSGGGSGLTIEEVDGTPTGSFTTLQLPNGTLTDEGSGVARYTPASGGGGSSGGVLPMAVFTPPPAAATFSWVNQDSAVATDLTDALRLQCPTNNTNLKLFLKTVPAAPYDLKVALSAHHSLSTALGCGLVWYDSVTGRAQTLMWTPIAANSVMIADSAYFNSVSSFNTDAGNYTPTMHSAPVWLRIRDDNTNRLTYFSLDGTHWRQITSVSRTFFFTATHLGLVVYGLNVDMIVHSWELT